MLQLLQQLQLVLYYHPLQLCNPCFRPGSKAPLQRSSEWSSRFLQRCSCRPTTMMSTASVMGLNHARRRRSDLMYWGGGYHGRYQGLGACLRQRSTFNFRLQLLFFPPVETCTLAPTRRAGTS